MKAKAILVTMALVTALAVGCTQQPAPAPAPAPAQTTPAPAATTPAATTPATTTSASIVDNEAAFEKAMSKDGTWILAPLKDLTFDHEIVLDGEFHDKNDATKDLKRKIALYTQDDKRNITGRFTVTAPKMTINSPNAGLWYGTFKGDIYVNAKNFTLYSATVDGNIYFANDDAKNTFKLDETQGACTVTGKQEVVK